MSALAFSRMTGAACPSNPGPRSPGWTAWPRSPVHPACSSRLDLTRRGRDVNWGATRKGDDPMQLAYHSITWGGVVGHAQGVTSPKDLHYLAYGSMEQAVRDIA